MPARTPLFGRQIDLDDPGSAATTMLAMTTELAGDSVWPADHGIDASSAQLVPGADSHWGLGLVTDGGGYVLSEHNGAVVDARCREAGGRLVRLLSAQEQSEPALARVAAALIRDAAVLLTAARDVGLRADPAPTGRGGSFPRSPTRATRCPTGATPEDGAVGSPQFEALTCGDRWVTAPGEDSVGDRRWTAVDDGSVVGGSGPRGSLPPKGS